VHVGERCIRHRCIFPGSPIGKPRTPPPRAGGGHPLDTGPQRTRVTEDVRALVEAELFERMTALGRKALTLHDLLVLRTDELAHDPMAGSTVAGDLFLEVAVEDPAPGAHPGRASPAYSARSVSSGSTRVARRAGSQHAPAAASARSADAPAKVAGSVGVTP